MTAGDDTFDDLIDRLPQRSRNDVLAVMRGEQPVRSGRGISPHSHPAAPSPSGDDGLIGWDDPAIRAWFRWFGSFAMGFMGLWLWFVLDVVS